MDLESTRIADLIFGSSSRFELWQKVLNGINAKTMAEVGVWKGDFAKEALEECKSIERYYMIDPWATLPNWNKPFNVETQIFEDVFEEAMSKTEFAAEKIVILRGVTKEVIDKIPDESLDFVYIDGDHTLRGITIDLIKMLPKLKKNGVIAGDDFNTNPWQHDIRFEPTLVCPFSIYFAEAMDLLIFALPFNQFLIQNKPNSSFSFVDQTGNYGDISLNKPPRREGVSGKFKTKMRKGLKKFGVIK